jgi:hypothetical protein
VTAAVGARWTGSGNGFKGDIDELLIYGRALAVEEIGSVMDSGLDKATVPELIASDQDVTMEPSGPENSTQ